MNNTIIATFAVAAITFFMLSLSQYNSNRITMVTNIETDSSETEDSSISGNAQETISGIEKSSQNPFLIRDTSLTEIEWRLSSIKKDEKIMTSVVNDGTFLTLRPDGTFSGKLSCNSVMGSYTIKGSVFAFSDIAPTEKLCSEEENVREQLLIESLSNVSEYTIEETTLTFISSDEVYKIELSSDNSQ